MTSQREDMLARRRGEMARRKDAAAAATSKKVTLEDWGRHLAFGVICGSITGFTVGAVDAYRIAKRAGNLDLANVLRVAPHEMGRSAFVVSGFFAVYQTVKCGCLAAGVTYPEVRVGGATAVALAPIATVQAFRRLSPYCLTLVAVDTYHTYVAPDATAL
mmetsp:Transcript_19085/g.56670  ORF Transcript_19085/g.56670 Transcript_19085/m.56670 type:complete len:160 (+) Transcript_19085:186-665(+)